MTARASALPATFAEALPLYAYDQSAPLCLQLGPKRSVLGGVTLQDVTYPSPVTGMITATLVFPAGKGPYPGVLFVHWLGNAATTNRTEFMDDALALARAGSTSLLVDALWSTNTAGKPGYDMAMAIEQVIELRRDLDVLLAQPGVDPTRIAYVGHDFGAMYGCILLAVDHRISYSALLTPTSHLSAWNLLITPLSGAERDTYIKRMAVFDPAMNLPHIQLKGLYLQFAQQDVYVSQTDAQTVYAAAPPPKETHVYATDHALAIPQATEDRLTWLKQRLRLVG
jgi:cephalosporin-C deacetylase-like acetyl esterase